MFPWSLVHLRGPIEGQCLTHQNRNGPAGNANAVDSTLSAILESMKCMQGAALYARVSTDAQQKEGHSVGEVVATMDVAVEADDALTLAEDGGAFSMYVPEG
jgi:hypothetical protein